MKIIALKLIKPNTRKVVNDKRYISIVKGLLSEDELEKTFKFYNNYELKGEWFEKTQDAHFSDNFNNPFNDSSSQSNNEIAINVCAIVGKNGSGKSSITELIIRLINNFGCSIIGDEKYIEAAERLHFIPDIFADLYFERDDIKYRLEQRGCEISLHSNEDIPFLPYINEYNLSQFSWSELDFRQSFNRSPLRKFFYSIVVNYSHYSYNIYDLKEEWDAEVSKFKNTSIENNIEDVDKCWLTGIFHKNDGYQTPIVLNPFRRDGYYIDTKRESELEKNRFFLSF